MIMLKNILREAGLLGEQYFGFGIEVFAETEYAFSVAATQTFK
jgi:hypothetical protein